MIKKAYKLAFDNKIITISILALLLIINYLLINDTPKIVISVLVGIFLLIIETIFITKKYNNE